MSKIIVSSGQVSSGIIVNWGGIVSSNGYTHPASGFMYVYSGGTASDTTVNSWSYMYVSSGGTANDTTVNSGGGMYVYNGGTANSTTVNGGSMYVYSGGTATNINWTPCVGHVYWDGNAYVTFTSQYSGVYYGSNNQLLSHVTTMTGKIVSSREEMNVMSGGTANSATVNSWGYMYVSSGGTANDTTVNSWGYMYVSLGGTASATTVNSWGNMCVSSGGTASATTVNDGWMYVDEGGTANDTTVNDGGRMYVSSGGTALAIKENGGYVEVDDGAQVTFVKNSFSGLVLSDNATVHSGTTANATIVNVGGRMYVSSGGTANDTTVNDGGWMYVSSGGTANSTTVNGGEMTVDSGGTANSTTVNGGEMTVDSGGTANSTTVNGGWMYVSSGGTANSTTVNDTTVDSGGYMYVDDGGTANSTTVNSNGWMYVSSGGTASDTIVNVGGRMYVSSGGTANSTTVNSGYMYVASGGTATIAFNPWQGDRIRIEDGAFVSYLERDADVYVGCSSGWIRKADTFSEMTIGNGISALVYSGGSIEDCRLQNGGTMEIFSGSEINGFAIKRDLKVSDTLVLNDVTVSGRAQITNNLRVSDVEIVSGGRVMIGEFASGSDFSVMQGASLFVLGGGVAENVTVTGGGAYVATGGEIKGNIEISQSGGLYLYGGSIVNGDIHVKGLLYVDEDMVSNGDITVDLNSSAMIENLDNLGDLQNFTVDATACSFGSYVLASGAVDYDGTVTVQNDEESCELAIGESSVVGENRYTLSKNDSTLSLAIEKSVTVLAKSDVDGNGVSDVMFQYTGGDYQIGFWMNGTNSWQGQGIGQPSEWKLIGAYDMDQNGKADLVMRGDIQIGSDKGAYIGYYKDGDVTNWQNISFLNNSYDIDWRLAVGNITGNSGCNSLVWHAPELGALGVWTDGTANWVSLGSGYNKDWVMQGCGDFDGNGKDEVLFTYEGNLYSIDIDGNFAALGQGVNGWEVRAIGDFSGDGQDDVVLFHTETGSVMKFENGTTYQNLGQLDAENWFIAGCGDYNNDQQDDLLVRQNSSGMLGYYESGDLSKWVELGRGVDSNWTVVA